ncbi:GntR family transcriptional regulator [Bradyrhizobium oligotrophicum]|uniref:GntR family transcriptional regulator n=1 Tax=Bradyrhizobium oligotrophicum TaxID=44255 RepID=UPI003EBCD94E
MVSASRTTQTYEDLKRELLDGVHAPGSKLPIDQLAGRFEVSLSAVREALSRLTSDRLVVAEPQRGFSVAPISASDLIDLTQVRIDIETRCLRSSILRGNLEWEGRLLDTWHQLSRTPHLVSSETFNPDWTRLHSRFHDELIAACDSVWWLRLRDQLFLQAERYRRMLLPYTRITRNVDDEHQEIFDLTLARDAERASAALAAHLQRTADILLASDAPFSDVPRVAPARPGSGRSAAIKTGKPASKPAS